MINQDTKEKLCKLQHSKLQETALLKEDLQQVKNRHLIEIRELEKELEKAKDENIELCQTKDKLQVEIYSLKNELDKVKDEKIQLCQIQATHLVEIG